MWTFLFIVFVWILVTLWAFLAGKTWLVLSSLGLLVLCIYDINHRKPTSNNNPQENNNKQETENIDDTEGYSSNNRHTISYSNEDDTYDGFYKQREEEYRQEYGNDFEDAIDDEWEERKRR